MAVPFVVLGALRTAKILGASWVRNGRGFKVKVEVMGIVRRIHSDSIPQDPRAFSSALMLELELVHDRLWGVPNEISGSWKRRILAVAEDSAGDLNGLMARVRTVAAPFWGRLESHNAAVDAKKKAEFPAREARRKAALIKAAKSRLSSAVRKALSSGLSRDDVVQVLDLEWVNGVMEQ